MDRLIGAFGVDAAEFAHQQAGDDRGNRVGNFISEHQGYHQHQTENRVRSLAVCRRSVIHFNRHIEHHEITPTLRQQGNLPPVADHQQDIAELQRLIDHGTIHRLAIALHADDIETKPSAERYLTHRFPNHLRIRDQRHLRHAHIQRLIGKILAAQHHRLEHLLTTELA